MQETKEKDLSKNALEVENSRKVNSGSDEAKESQQRSDSTRSNVRSRAFKDKTNAKESSSSSESDNETKKRQPSPVGTKKVCSKLTKYYFNLFI